MRAKEFFGNQSTFMSIINSTIENAVFNESVVQFEGKAFLKIINGTSTCTSFKNIEQLISVGKYDKVNVDKRRVHFFNWLWYISINYKL